MRKLSFRRDGSGGGRGAPDVLLGIRGREIERVGFVGRREAGHDETIRVETVGRAGGVSDISVWREHGLASGRGAVHRAAV